MFISRDHFKLHYLHAGKRKGKLMLFLHGFPEFSLAWQKQIDYFSKDYCVVAPDLRGFNLSGPFEKNEKNKKLSWDDLVEDVHAFVMHFSSKEKCFLIGHDWGGMIAICFAAKYPQHLEKLILINAPHPKVLERAALEGAAHEKAAQYVALFKNPRAEKMISAYHYRYFWEYLMPEVSTQKLFSIETQAAYEAAWGIPGALTSMLAYYRQWPLPMTSVFLNKIETPTLMILGEKDSVLLSALDETLHYFDDIKTVCISDGSHWVVHEKPVLIKALIAQFVGCFLCAQ